MAKQTINIGSIANDRSGDNLRTAFQKVNSNFEELYTQLNGFGLTNSIPSLTGNTGKFLSNNGTALNWTALTIPTDINQLTDSSQLLPGPEIKISAGATPPSSHPVGTLWYDTVGGRLYVYYDSFWADASPRGVGVATSIGQGTKLSTATGTAGQISFDANYVYICTATNTWKRAPLVGGY